YEITKKSRLSIYLLGIIGLLVHILGTWYFSYQIGEVSRIFKGYTNVPSILYSVAIFTAFKYLNIDLQNILATVTKRFTSVTFGIYMIHWFIIRKPVKIYRIEKQ